MTIRISNDRELQEAIDTVDKFIDELNAIEFPCERSRELEEHIDELGDMIHEYEKRTDILNREPDGSESGEAP